MMEDTKEFAMMEEKSCFLDEYGVSEEERRSRFDEQHRKMDWQGMEGLVKRAILREEAERSLTCAEFKKHSVEIGVPAGSPADRFMQALADRCSRIRSTHPNDFKYWAMFAVMNLFDERKFNRLLEEATDMGLMFADDLVQAFIAMPLDQRLDRARPVMSTDAGPVKADDRAAAHRGSTR
jgi:hypothetical protein